MLRVMRLSSRQNWLQYFFRHGWVTDLAKRFCILQKKRQPLHSYDGVVINICENYIYYAGVVLVLRCKLLSAEYPSFMTFPVIVIGHNFYKS
jgi:hypothetical protein